MTGQTRDLIPALAFGFLLGLLIGSLLQEPSLPSSSSLMNAGVTILVGWWIHNILRRRGELDRVPIDYLSRLSIRIDGLVSECLDPKHEKKPDAPRLLENFVMLSHAVYSLRMVAARLDLANLDKDLVQRFLSFKSDLTGQMPSNRTAAVHSGHELRVAAMIIQWHGSQRILDSHIDVRDLAGR